MSGIHRRLAGGLRLAAVVAGYGLLSSCTVNPATGERELTLMSPAQEKAIGAEQHPKLLEQFGGPYDDPATAAYVATVGGRMAANSELAAQGFTFTLLNSKIVNAFALPGGYVYISRGLLALMNDEAELASVLGHEVGHVTARHAARRQTQSVFGGILGMGVGILTGSSELGRLASQGAQVYLLSYSRGQEYEADTLGVRYMARAGYDPYGAARMLASLGRDSALQAKILGRDEADQIPSWARTHPLAEDRVARATQAARATGIEPGTGARNQAAFLDAIDGLVYDDSPAQGVVRGREFWHPKFGFMFAVPDGFALQNGETSVLASGPGEAAILFSGGRIQAGQDIASYMNALWSKLSNGKGQPLGNLERIKVNGMDAATGTTRLQSQDGAMDLRVVAIRFSETQAFHFLFLSSTGQTAGLADAYRRSTYSFRRLTAEEAAGIKGRHIAIVTVAPGDSAASLAQRMAFDNHRLEHFLVLNGLEDASALRAGQRVKLVVFEP
ncbi:MAG: peptidase M48 [Alphaproteobacteria bacterium]|nr:MAG: peptidase M48 [Alphaproteobacteria bacterium]